MNRWLCYSHSAENIQVGFNEIDKNVIKSMASCSFIFQFVSMNSVFAEKRSKPRGFYLYILVNWAVDEIILIKNLTVRKC